MFHKRQEFLDELNDCQLLKKNCDTLSHCGLMSVLREVFNLMNDAKENPEAGPKFENRRCICTGRDFSLTSGCT
jgi:hypothetical protein